MSKHTPGPWAFSGHDFRSTATGESIGFVYQCQNNRGGHNARLIAAAPDLLAVCREVLDHLPDATCKGSWDAVSARLLQDVIEKATGERPPLSSSCGDDEERCPDTGLTRTELEALCGDGGE